MARLRSVCSALLVVMCLMLALCLVILDYRNKTKRFMHQETQSEQDDSEHHFSTPPAINHTCPLRYSIDASVIKLFGNVESKAQTPSMNNRTDSKILILTPISNSAHKLERYFSLLCSLTYPHDRLFIALGEDSSMDNTFSKVNAISEELRVNFGGITVYKLPSRHASWNHLNRHGKNLQFQRRQHLAKSRNELLLRAINEEFDWVLWLDSDIEYYPPNLIQLLLSPNASIIAPVCLMSQVKDSKRTIDVYDRNTWRDTEQSIDYINIKTKEDANFLMLEGYFKSKRLYLTDLRHEGRVVPIDGVGGCCLLVRASLHRQGLVFPTFLLDSHIETEGLGKMAARMGIKMYGLPFVGVYHES